MSSALIGALFALLGLGLAVTSTACLILWRQVRALSTGTPARTSPTSFQGDESQRRGNAKARASLTRKLDQLSRQFQAVEARLTRLESTTRGEARSLLPLETESGKQARIDEGQPGALEGPTLIAVPNLAMSGSPTTETASELDRRFGSIWGMADEGVPVEVISRQSGYPIGQVELILGLRRQLLGTDPRAVFTQGEGVAEHG